MGDSSEVQRDLLLLEAELKRLEAEYNMFFAGRLPLPPFETRGGVEALIKRWDRGYIQGSEARFRFLSEASAALATSLDHAATLEQVVRLAVQVLADWCIVDLVGEDGRERGGQDLRRLGGDGDRGRDAHEDEERRHQEAAADPEEAGNEAHRCTHPEDEKNAHRHFSDRQIDLQPGSPMAGAATLLLQHHAGRVTVMF